MAYTVLAQCIAYIATIVIAIFIIPSEHLFTAAAIIVAAVFVLFIASVFKKKIKNIFLVSIFCAIAIINFLIYSNLTLKPAYALQNTTADITATVTNSEISDSGNKYYTISINTINGEKAPRLLNARLFCKNYDSLNDYDKISAKVRFFENNISKNERFYSSDIIISASTLGEIEITNKENFSLLREICKIRDKMIFNIRSRLPQKTGDIISGILFGKKDYIDYETTLLFRKSGISHLLAVSGLHLSIIVSIIDGILCLFFINKKARVILCYILTAILCIMVGFTPSITRSAIMTSLILFSQILRLNYHAPTGVGISAFIICLFNPMAIVNIGFLLSFSATIGLILSKAFIERLRDKFSLRSVSVPRLIFHFILSQTLPCFFAFLFTIPITICSFGTIATYSVLVNLIVSPILPYLLGFSLFGALFTLIPVEIVSTPFLFIAKHLTNSIIWVSENITSLDFCEITIKSEILLPLTLLLSLLVIIPLLSKNKTKNTVISILLCIPIICSVMVCENKINSNIYKISIIPSEQTALMIKSDSLTLVNGFSKQNSFDILRRFSADENLSLLIIESAKDEDISAIPSLIKRININNITVPEKHAASITTLDKKIKGYTSENFSANLGNVSVKTEISGKNTAVFYQINGFKIAFLTITEASNLPESFSCDLLIANGNSLPFLDRYLSKYFIFSEVSDNPEQLKNLLAVHGSIFLGDSLCGEFYLKGQNLLEKQQMF